MDNSITFISCILREFEHNEISKTDLQLSIVTLASSIKNRNCYLAIRDLSIDFYDQDEINTFVDYLLNFNSKYYGFSTINVSYHISLEIARVLKERNPEVIIIMGGPQATATAWDSMETFPWVDYIICNEGDFSLNELLEKLDQNQSIEEVPGLLYRKGEQIYQNKAKMIQNLDSLNIPRYTNITNYKDFAEKLIGKTFELDIGRGCPFSCTYCSTCQFFNQTYRIKSNARILEEINVLTEDYQSFSISFTHDMLTYNKANILELCELLKVEDKYTWTCSVRLDTIDEDIIRSFSESNCMGVFIGIETGSQRMQSIIKKRLNLNTLLDKLDLFNKYQVEKTCAFMCGFPEETMDDIQQTVNCIVDCILKFARVQISSLSPLPLTEVYEKNKDNLSFDGFMGDFSRILLSESEKKNYILKYPRIFSSFYYINHPTINRNFFIFLNLLVNKSNNYRFTIFCLLAYFKEYHPKVFEKYVLNFCNEVYPKLIKIDYSLRRKFFDQKLKLIVNKVTKKYLPYLCSIFDYELTHECLKQVSIVKYLSHKENNENFTKIEDERKVTLRISDKASFLKCDYDVKKILIDCIKDKRVRLDINKEEKKYCMMYIFKDLSELYEIDDNLYHFLSLCVKPITIDSINKNMKKRFENWTMTQTIEAANYLISENILTR